jgi:hypothetical protein
MDQFYDGRKAGTIQLHFYMSMSLTVLLLVEKLQKLVEERNQIKQGTGKLIQFESLNVSMIFKSTYHRLTLLFIN